jgi:dihydroxy-acid dehydratase
VQNGDPIRIDVDAHILDLEVSPQELATRRERRGEPPLRPATGYLSIYQRSVQPMSTGAVLVDTVPSTQ